MKTNKIFAAAMAGLCAVSTMGVSAFAVSETVKTASEKSYKISAGFQAPAIDVTVPTAIKAIINPYMIAIDDDTDGTYEVEGVASPKYAIENNSDKVGIKIKATYYADGLDGIVESADKVVENDKKLAYVTLNAEVGGTATTAEDEDADADADAGAVELVMSTKETTSALIELKEGKVGQMWIGGVVPEEPAEKWTIKDKLTINVVLDLTPYNTGATSDEEEEDAYVGLTALTVKKGGTDKITFAADKKTYEISGCAEDDMFIIAYTETANSDVVVTCVDYNAGTGKVAIPGSGATTLTIKVTDKTDNTKTDTYTINFTAA